VRNVLLDTGALVALLDRSERNHARCVAFLEGFEGRLVSTEAVLTETLYLLGPALSAQRVCLEFFLRDGAVLAPSTRESLARCLTLMERYANVPMDFADATLVYLAEELDTAEVFTLDRRGFGVYRIGRNKPFTIYP
jgi:predicted nucleic acid-binding protein